jgi:tetratricopeptide (TPR) repeat protein
VFAGFAVALGMGGFARQRQRPPSHDVPSEAAGWLQDLRPALEMAKAQQKDILLEFSAPQEDAGSPGALESGVLDRTSFRRDVGRSFILVRMASSSDMPPARITQVTTCAERLGVARFPTFVLMDSDAKPYARSELVASNEIDYQNEFSRLRKLHAQRDESLALANATKGIERAKHLDAALTAVESFAESEYADLRHEVIDLDPDNAAGLRAKYEPAILARQIDATIQNEVYPLADRGDYSAAIARIDRLMNEIKPTRAQLQLMMAFKGQLFYSLGDKGKAAELMDKAITIDPASESAGRARAAKLQMSGG